MHLQDKTAPAGEPGRYAIGHVCDAGLRIIQLCPFIAKRLKRHPEDEATVDWPQAAADVERAEAGTA